ncbi:16257_t:CDS:2, partial [Racocetra persica]
LNQELAGVLSEQPTDKEVKSTIVNCPVCGECKGVSKFANHLARCFTESSQGESSQKPISGVRLRRSSSRSTTTSQSIYVTGKPNEKKGWK